MTENKIDMFIMSNGKHFESHHIGTIKEILTNVDESKWAVLSATKFYEPTTILIISILIGGFGIDRFMIGDTGIGIGKLLTCGGFGIWTIVDWFTIQKSAREKNMEKIMQILT